MTDSVRSGKWGAPCDRLGMSPSFYHNKLAGGLFVLGLALNLVWPIHRQQINRAWAPAGLRRLVAPETAVWL